MVKILLSEKNARLLAQNIDGWSDAGACEGGLTPDERKALNSIYDQIMRQVTLGAGRCGVCDCQNPEPKTGVALVSESCPIHGRG
jgi:hypothetical protein